MNNQGPNSNYGRSGPASPSAGSNRHYSNHNGGNYGKPSSNKAPPSVIQADLDPRAYNEDLE